MRHVIGAGATSRLHLSTSARPKAAANNNEHHLNLHDQLMLPVTRKQQVVVAGLFRDPYSPAKVRVSLLFRPMIVERRNSKRDSRAREASSEKEHRVNLRGEKH